MNALCSERLVGLSRHGLHSGGGGENNLNSSSLKHKRGRKKGVPIPFFRKDAKRKRSRLPAGELTRLSHYDPSKPSWVSLPMEILWRILSFVGVEHVQGMQAVCRTWSHVVRSEGFWRHIYQTQFGGVRFIGETWRFHCVFAAAEMQKVEMGTLEDAAHRIATAPGMKVFFNPPSASIPMHERKWFWAADRGHAQVLVAMYESGEIDDVNITDGYTCQSALFRAVNFNRVKAVEALVSLGADTNQRSQMGVTPLVRAALLGHLEVVKVLVDNKVDVNAAGKAGATALSMAAQHSQQHVMRYLLSLPVCDISKPLRGGESPVHVCAMLGLLAELKILQEHGADIHRKAKNRMTPLYSAAEYGNLEVVKYLVEQGADVFQAYVLWKGARHSALDEARRRGFWAVASFLEPLYGEQG